MTSSTPPIPLSAPVESINSPPHPGAAAARLRNPVSRPIRVLLAADPPIVRRGIVACLEEHAHLAVVGEAADGQEALLKARQLVPDVLLADIVMPHLTGLALAEALHKELPQIRVLLLSTCSSQEFVRRCVQSGARGYILKQASPEEFVQAIEMVNAG